MQVKTCSICKKEKPISAFAYRRKILNEYQSGCRECRNKKVSFCKCGAPIKPASKTCVACKISNQHKESASYTIADKIDLSSPSNRYGYIRYRARIIGNLVGFKCCRECGYDKHFEVCHIKAISDFDPQTLITEVNKPENLVPLCPNCHWEFDNGLLEVAAV